MLYRYTVRAYNESGMSDYNSSNITESYFVSKPITKLSNSAKGINVNWAKSKNASGYYIYRKDKKSDGWTKVKTVDSKTSSWMDNSAKSGKIIIRLWHIVIRPEVRLIQTARLYD